MGVVQSHDGLQISQIMPQINLHAPPVSFQTSQVCLQTAQGGPKMGVRQPRDGLRMSQMGHYTPEVGPSTPQVDLQSPNVGYEIASDCQLSSELTQAIFASLTNSPRGDQFTHSSLTPSFEGIKVGSQPFPLPSPSSSTSPPPPPPPPPPAYSMVNANGFCEMTHYSSKLSATTIVPSSPIFTFCQPSNRRLNFSPTSAPRVSHTQLHAVTRVEVISFMYMGNFD